MAFVIGTFVGVLALVVGVCWLLLLRPEAATQRVLEKRMRPPDTGKQRRLAIPKSELRDASGPALFRKLQTIVDQSGIASLNVPKLIFMCWMSGLVAAMAAWTLSPNPNPIVTGAVGVVGMLPPYFWIKRKASSRMWKFEEQFPEAIDLIARALRAGHALPTGLSMVASELGEPVGPEFKLLYDRQNFGMPLPDALRSFGHRVPLLDARFFVTAVLTQRESGGNLSGVLDNLSSVIRERFKVKRQVKVISAHGRMTAAILMGLPPTLALAQAVLAPDNIAMLINDPLGQKMLIGAGVLQGLGMLVINKIVNIEY